MENQLDAQDQELVAAAVLLRDQQPGPRMGDYVLFATGQLERFSHDWGTTIQTSPGGSFYLSKSGIGSLSCGGLNPGTPTHALEPTTAILPGRFWTFHHGIAGAHRGVDFDIPCRVFVTKAAYAGFLGDAFQNPRLSDYKASLAKQLEPDETAGAAA